MFKEKVVKIILALTFLVIEYKESSRRFTMSIIFLLWIKGESFSTSKSELEMKVESLDAP